MERNFLGDRNKWGRGGENCRRRRSFSIYVNWLLCGSVFHRIISAVSFNLCKKLDSEKAFYWVKKRTEELSTWHGIRLKCENARKVGGRKLLEKQTCNLFQSVEQLKIWIENSEKLLKFCRSFAEVFFCWNNSKLWWLKFIFHELTLSKSTNIENAESFVVDNQKLFFEFAEY